MVHHVALELRDADAPGAERFWALLGFARVEPPPALQGRTLWLERGATQIHVLLTDAPFAPPAGHVAIVAEDYDEALARLRAAGFEPEPRAEHWGSPRCFVRSPGGHRVEVMRHPPGAAA